MDRPGQRAGPAGGGARDRGDPAGAGVGVPVPGPGHPAGGGTRFVPADPATVRGEINADLAAAINVFSPARPPATLAGLPARGEAVGTGSVGSYGTGFILLVALPLPGRLSRQPRGRLADSPGATRTAAGVRLAVGPLALLLTDPVDRRSWLLTGTLTAATLDRAAAELAR